MSEMRVASIFYDGFYEGMILTAVHLFPLQQNREPLITLREYIIEVCKACRPQDSEEEMLSKVDEYIPKESGRPQEEEEVKKSTTPLQTDDSIDDWVEESTTAHQTNGMLPVNYCTSP